MDRVIVDALSGGPNPPPSAYLNMSSIRSAAGVADHSPASSGSRSPPSSPKENGRGRTSPPQVNGGSPLRLNGESSVSSLTAESLLIAESQQPIGSATAAIASAKSAAASMNPAHCSSSTSGVIVSGLVSRSPINQDDDEEEDDEDKPLNLSSSKVLRASNQQIIDHFIDKLLTTGSECGEG